ncbi:TIGR04283 family arsenosugar biosynthesis glycosyltransferase [Adhaeribacter radiodurans]|uniref:TIGR04283 family arsenosugar biosynthesis glycosyltransferase n=2 Tax=Adhaeribacter radiodurans TaxID=2745197 RepID=A0A7L7LFD3_9BACT|nr:TIGR04283 family arsenosugar biosynthesis glycosyltransferase [Adhaeribacter radiodurans]
MISVIIPTYNESEHIEKTIKVIFANGNRKDITEVIVVDGGSTDATVQKATAAGARVIMSNKKGRAVQLNYAATLATGSIFYFLHADTLPPPNFTTNIIHSVQAGNGSGCFLLRFDLNNWFLQANCWFTRFAPTFFRFGDQSLFVTKENFAKAGGYNEEYRVLEDQEIIKRLKKTGKFVIIKKPVLTSARKYVSHGIYKTQGIFYLIYALYRLGFSQNRLVSTYKKLIPEEKI